MTDEEFKLHIVEKLAKLEQGVFGNGDPGLSDRIGTLSGRVREVEKKIWIWSGAAAAVGWISAHFDGKH